MSATIYAVYSGLMNSSLTLLGLLSVGPSYGYDLKHAFDRFFGSEQPLAFGQVYATLSRLSRDGLITPVGEESGGGPNRKRYQVTDGGRQRLVEWMFTPEVPNESLQSDLFAKTVVALLVDQDAERLLDIQRSRHMQRMRDLTRLKQQSDLMHVLLYDHALFHIEADLRWIDMTSARLTQLKQEISHS
jgi:DNA-binding PadR family transcriptional regulator